MKIRIDGTILDVPSYLSYKKHMGGVIDVTPLPQGVLRLAYVKTSQEVKGETVIIIHKSYGFIYRPLLSSMQAMQFKELPSQNLNTCVFVLSKNYASPRVTLKRLHGKLCLQFERGSGEGYHLERKKEG